jgi:predicted aminopeptidase
MFDPSGAEGEVPAFASAYRSRADALGDAPPADAAFEIGLRALLDGLRDRHARLHAESS